jgi:hypothetical protein
MKNLLTSTILFFSFYQITNAQLQNKFYAGSSLGCNISNSENEDRPILTNSSKSWMRSVNVTPQMWYGIHQNFSLGAAFGYQNTHSFNSNTTGMGESIRRNISQGFIYTGGIQYIYPTGEKIYIVSTLLGGITEIRSKNKTEYKSAFYTMEENSFTMTQATGSLSIGLLYRPSEHWMWQVSSNFMHYQMIIKSRFESNSAETYIPKPKNSQLVFTPDLSSLSISAFYVF